MVIPVLIFIILLACVILFTFSAGQNRDWAGEDQEQMDALKEDKK